VDALFLDRNIYYKHFKKIGRKRRVSLCFGGRTFLLEISLKVSEFPDFQKFQMISSSQNLNGN